VEFGHDDDADYMRIDNLRIQASGNILFPSTTDNFELSVGNMHVEGSPHVTCYATDSGTVVTVNADARLLDLGGARSLTVNGTHNHVNINGNINGSATITSNGTFNILGTCGDRVRLRATEAFLLVAGTDVLDVEIVSGSVTAYQVNRITGPGVLHEGITYYSWVKMRTGSLILGHRTGANAFGVYGNVFVDKPNGGATINFANQEHANGRLYVRAYDGLIDAWGVRGLTDIRTTSNGNANIKIGFSAIHNDSALVINGAREPNAHGRIEITLIQDDIGNIPGAAFHFRGQSRIKDHITPDRLEEPRNCANNAHNHINGNSSCIAGTCSHLKDWEIIPGTGSGTCGPFLEHIPAIGTWFNVLHVKTQSSVDIYTNPY
jgi:hypothetical protein